LASAKINQHASGIDVTSPRPALTRVQPGRGWLLIWAAMLAAGIIVVRAVLGASGALAPVGLGLVDVALFVRSDCPPSAQCTIWPQP
jgi:hypothetical protein